MTKWNEEKNTSKTQTWTLLFCNEKYNKYALIGFNILYFRRNMHYFCKTIPTDTQSIYIIACDSSSFFILTLTKHMLWLKSKGNTGGRRGVFLYWPITHTLRYTSLLLVSSTPGHVTCTQTVWWRDCSRWTTLCWFCKHPLLADSRQCSIKQSFPLQDKQNNNTKLHIFKMSIISNLFEV